jgi:hypothetical protein
VPELPDPRPKLIWEETKTFTFVFDKYGQVDKKKSCLK